MNGGNKVMTRHGAESRKRTIVKAVSWRAVATVTTMTLVYVFTRDEAISLSVGGLDVFLKLLFYYLHERGWHKISWGRTEHPLGSLKLQKEMDPADLEKVKGFLQDLGYMD